MCEIDCRVVENVMKWFNFKQWVIQEHKESGRINLTYNDGSKFVETIPNETFDAIIIDCTDPLTEDSPAKALTTVEFLT
jgi:spermidine synthase